MQQNNFGKIPPQAIDVEDSVLGAILNQEGIFERLADILKPQHFYLELNQVIFSAFVELKKNNSPIDILTVFRQIEKTGSVVEMYDLTSKTRCVLSYLDIEVYAGIIVEKFNRRELIRISLDGLANAYSMDEDVEETLNTMETALYKISDSNLKTDFVDVADGLVELINRVDFLKSQNTSVTGVSTGYPVLNGITHGWQPTDLIILAARPSIGKTAFALNLARNATIDRINPVSVGFFSLEMSTQQLLQRLVAMDSGVHMSALASGSVDNPLTAFVSGRLFGEGEDVGKIYACDQAGLGLFELKSKARRMVGKFGVKLIIIDYLQLMSGDRGYGGNREQEISSISRGLKGMAKELKVPVIALSQLNRLVEARGAKTPRLSDLRESGAIEQDADMVAFLYRPDEEAIKQDAGLQNTGLLTIAKHRNGSLGEVVFRVNNGLQQWREVTESVF